MSELWSTVAPYLTTARLLAGTRAAVLILVGFGVAKLAGRLIRRLTKDHLPEQQAVLLRRIAFYLILLLFLVAAFHELGFNLGVLLGAAGVLSVAIGFASQTSASNVISGLFLIGEQSFGVGDVIQAGGTTGEVLSIDLLSVKLRTFDNIFVRIPNESLIKSEVRTYTKFPIRRLDFRFGIGYNERIPRARKILLELAGRNPACLQEPEPLFEVLKFADSAVEIRFAPWATLENYAELKNTLQSEIKERFQAEGIEIPFPQVQVELNSEASTSPTEES